MSTMHNGKTLLSEILLHKLCGTCRIVNICQLLRVVIHSFDVIVYLTNPLGGLSRLSLLTTTGAGVFVSICCTLRTALIVSYLYVKVDT
jgi:hypothetical protein